MGLMDLIHVLTPKCEIDYVFSDLSHQFVGIDSSSLLPMTRLTMG